MEGRKVFQGFSLHTIGTGTMADSSPNPPPLNIPNFLGGYLMVNCLALMSVSKNDSRVDE